MVATSRRNPLINRSFAFLWAAQSLSFLGDQVFDTTLVVWIAVVLGRGQSWAPLAVSGLFIVIAIPTLLVGPLAGVIVDRVDKRRLLIGMDGLRALLVASLLPVAGLGGFHLPVAVQLTWTYVVVFLLTGCSQFFAPARLVLIGDLVPADQLPQATSLSQVNMSISTILGPPLAVPVLFVLGIQWALLANALSFVLSLVLVSLVRAVPTAPAGAPAAPSSFLSQLAEGFRFAAGNVVVRTMLIAIFIATLGAGALNALDIFFLVNNLHVSANLFGFLGAAMGAGVLAGAIVSGVFAQRIGMERVFWGCILVIGLLLLVYARMTNLALAAAVLFLTGIPEAAVNVVAGPMLLKAVPRALVGRVVSLVNPIVAIAGILSTAMAGYLASSVLLNFHEEVGGLHLGTYDTIFSVAGLLVLGGGVYSYLNLRHPHERERDPASEAPGSRAR